MKTRIDLGGPSSADARAASGGSQTARVPAHRDTKRGHSLLPETRQLGGRAWRWWRNRAEPVLYWLVVLTGLGTAAMIVGNTVIRPRLMTLDGLAALLARWSWGQP